MKANEVNLNRFLAQTDTQFVIPVYQRNYDWKRQQCRQLLDDIIAVGGDKKRNAHFIGSIVFIHDDIFSSSEIKELVIIDGQQRITTITLIYIVIYRLALELQNEQLTQKINETYLINKFAQEEEKLKLKPTENNDKALRYLLKADSYESYPEFSRLIENYTYFKTRITKDNLDSIRVGLDKLMFVEVSLERGKDDPQRIFESLNSTGLDLTQADLIRNYILMGLNRKQQLKIYQDYWQPIEQHATDEKNNTNQVSDFIRDFLTIQNREIPNKNKVYEEFKTKYPDRDMEHVENILPKLKKLVYHYNKIINPEHEPNKDVREQLKWINRLEINVSYPFLLEVYDDYIEQVIDKATFIDILELLQSFVWRRFIVGLPTNALNKIFMRLYEDIDKTHYIYSLQYSLLKRKGNQRFPNNQEVINLLKEKDMYNIQNKNRMYFLERLENYQNNERVQLENNPEITIEHIFPQNPDPKWKIELGDEEYNLVKTNYLNTIANLTLSGNNGHLGNKAFIQKRDMNIDGKEQGYRYSRLWLNKLLASLDKWDYVELEKRFALITERFMKIWKYPIIEIKDGYEYDEVNIFDADEPTHKKLAYVIFFNQKLAITRVTELYVHVMKTLFELQPDTFFSTDLAERITLTQQKEYLRQPAQINDLYYIETNIDNSGKFDRIKYALSLVNYEDDLFIKYADETNVGS